jgi:L-amino acid N-acyltransferase YncA
MIIRDAVDTDLTAVHRIYAHEVLTGIATFEEVPPTLDELIARKESVRAAGLPYLVAEVRDEVVGFSYASPYRARSAYRFTIEDSVYVAADAQGTGVGSALLTELIARCEVGPARQMIAVIGNSANDGSVRLHERLGFRRVGTLAAVGFKFGHWVDTVLMQRELPGDPQS